MACSYPEPNMEILVEMRALLLGLAWATALLGQVDARQVVRRAVAADDRNWKVARNYTFLEREELRRLDSQGRVKSKQVRTYDVRPLEGSPYRRLVERDDHPLPPSEEKTEQENLAKSIAERRKETEAQRAERLAEYERGPAWQRDARRELPEAFDFRLAGEEILDGHSLYVIEATPRKGYQPESRTAKMFLHLRGKLWVDKQDLQLVKAEAEVIDTIWVGLFLVRVAKGSHAVFERTRVTDGVWLPRRRQAFASARLGLLKALRIEQEVNYSRYRNFQTDARIISPVKAKWTPMRRQRFATLIIGGRSRDEAKPARLEDAFCACLDGPGPSTLESRSGKMGN